MRPRVRTTDLQFPVGSRPGVRVIAHKGFPPRSAERLARLQATQVLFEETRRRAERTYLYAWVVLAGAFSLIYAIVTRLA